MLNFIIFSQEYDAARLDVSTTGSWAVDISGPFEQRVDQQA
jgi:hypothetical protein